MVDLFVKGDLYFVSVETEHQLRTYMGTAAYEDADIVKFITYDSINKTDIEYMFRKKDVSGYKRHLHTYESYKMRQDKDGTRGEYLSKMNIFSVKDYKLLGKILKNFVYDIERTIRLAKEGRVKIFDTQIEQWKFDIPMAHAMRYKLASILHPGTEFKLRHPPKIDTLLDGVKIYSAADLKKEEAKNEDCKL